LGSAEQGFVERLEPVAEILEAVRFAYKMGQLKISELQARAKKALGLRFNVRDFHEQVLMSAALPDGARAEDRRLDLPASGGAHPSFCLSRKRGRKRPPG
jgi:hypothetical protein